MSICPLLNKCFSHLVMAVEVQTHGPPRNPGIPTVEPYDGAYLENNRAGTAPGLAERCIPAAVSAAVPCLSCRMGKINGHR